MTRPRNTSKIGKLEHTACVACCCLISACGSTERSAVDQGRDLFESKALSQSGFNDFTCVTCHDTSQVSSKKTGGALSGVTVRTAFWAGQEPDLLSSVNVCRNYFMTDNRPLSATDNQARVLYAYLASLEPADPTPAPFTIVTDIQDVPRGHANPGQALFVEACSSCHGAMHTGEGRLSTLVPVLPEETLAAHDTYSARGQRLVFIEKIRHGPFLDYGGTMPPFSEQVLSDDEVSDLLEGLGVLGE